MHSLAQLKAAAWTLAAAIVALVVEAVVMWNQGDVQGVMLLVVCALVVFGLIALAVYAELNRG